MSPAVLQMLYNNLVSTVIACDTIKSCDDFDKLDRDIILRLSLIHTLSKQVVEKLPLG